MDLIKVSVKSPLILIKKIEVTVMNDITICIDNDPLIKTYSHLADEYSVIRKDHPCLKNWICSQLTQIKYHYDDINGHSIDFFTHHCMDLPLLSSEKIYRHEIKNEEEFNSIVIEHLKLGYCTELYCNEYYIPERRAYQEMYFPHINMVYGYSFENQIYNLIGYGSNGKYDQSTIEKSQLYYAYSTIETDIPVFFLKQNETVSYDIEWWKISYDLNNYINSGQDELSYHKDNYLFGLDVMRKIIEILNQIVNNQYYEDLRIFYLINEHKKVMFMKYNYWTNEGVKFKYSNISELLKQNYNETSICLNLFLKYIITKDQNIIDKIIKKLDLVIRTEEVVFPILLDGINEHKRSLIGLIS